MHGILCGRVVAVAQLVEPRVVIPVVAGSSPVRHLFLPALPDPLARILERDAIPKAGNLRFPRNLPFLSAVVNGGSSWVVTYRWP